MTADRDFEPTPTQRQAMRVVDRDVVLSAGPGSGKTRVLVGRIERLLERGVSPDQVAAITFTRKAAAEMKGRLRKELMDKWRRTWDEDPERARNLRSLAWSVQRMFVGTIHSFCSSILHRHPHRAGLDPEFEVLDPSRARVLLDDAISESVREAVATWEGAHADYLRELMDDKGHSYIGMLRDLHAAGRRIDISWSEIGDMTCRSLKELMPAGIEETGGLTEEEAGTAMALLEELFELRWDSDVQKTKAYPPRIEVVAGQWERVRPAIKDGDLSALRDVVRRLRAPGPIPKKLRGAIENLRQVHRDAAQRHLYQSELNAALTLVRLMQNTDERYRQKKEDMAVIDHDDQQRMALQLLRDAPEARKKLRRQYPHLMVDEFQDTDGIQWELVRLLRSIGDKTGGLMFVGDADQSIYRFRGADVDVFRDARRNLRDLGACDLSMTRNFRSTAELISIYNSCFCQLLSGFEQLKPADDDPRPDLGPAADVVLVRREKKETPHEARVHQGFAAVRWIEDYVKGGGSYGDVAVLVRARSAVEPVVEALEDCGIPHRIIGGRDFYISQEISDIRMLLTWLDNEKEDVALAGLLRSPFFGLDDAMLYAISRQNGHTFYDRLKTAAEHYEDIEPVKNRLRRWRDKSRLLSLDELLLFTLDESGYREAHAVTGDGEQVVANLQKIIAQARQEERESGLSPGEFAHELAALSEMESDEGNAPVESEEADVVRVMTIHRAKGLEFPVVVVPDADASAQRFRDQLIVHPEKGLGVATRARNDIRKISEMSKDSFFDCLREREKEAALQEEQRIFYVACTRAERRLVLVGASKNLTEDCCGLLPGEALDRIRPGSHTFLGWFREGLDELNESLVQWHPYFPQEDDLRVRETEGESPDVIDTMVERAKSGMYDVAEPAGVLRDRSHSVTALVDYRLCPRLYLLRHILRWPELQPEAEVRPKGEKHHGDPLLFGTLVHRVCELLPEVSLEKAAHVALFEQQIPPGDDELIEKVKQVARCYTKSELYAEILHAGADRQSYSEWAFSCPLPGDNQSARSYLVGKIDQLYLNEDSTWTVVDLKTDRIEREEIAERADHHAFQVQLYAWVVGRLMGVQEVRGQVHFLRPDVTWEVPVGCWRDVEEQVCEMIACIERSEEADNFPPEGGALCSWCGYGFHCSGSATKGGRC